jgi:hypothetical protein
MRRVKRLLTFMLLTFFIFSLPFVSYDALAYSSPTPEQLNSQPNYFSTETKWYGGAVGDNPIKVEGKTLGELSTMALQEAAFSGGLVEYKTEDGAAVIWAYPVFDRPKCENIYEKAWQEGKLILNESREVCLISQGK